MADVYAAQRAALAGLAAPSGNANLLTDTNPDQAENAGKGALGGAASGAAAGTAVLPGWGTAIGGVLGGVLGAIGGAMGGDQGAVSNTGNVVATLAKKRAAQGAGDAVAAAADAAGAVQ